MARRRCPGRGRGCGATHFAMAKFSSEKLPAKIASMAFAEPQPKISA
jgi:hypothetical protein